MSTKRAIQTWSKKKERERKIFTIRMIMRKHTYIVTNQEENIRYMKKNTEKKVQRW